ncbi:ATP-binding protein [Cochlodiniinecator piscidefendens]|uniref:ATP-binding protein n=1 Tax=Cochlodiniinecator piscidefendens TaxID=2715756 RepID=UPI00140E132B|nr:ATP-binding protein [Cochlodiniinecator piscidefendens]
MSSPVLSDVLLAIPSPIIVIDQNGIVIEINPAAEELLGQRLRGRNYVSAMRQPALLKTVEKAISNRTCENSHFQADETSYKVTATPSAESGLVVSIEDISSLETAGQMRKDFVANVSHELRTPLTALLGFVETLRGAAKNDSTARDRFLEIMEKEALRMNRLVQDLLSLSRVEGEERMRPTEDVNIENLTRSAIEALRPMSDSRNVQIEMGVQCSSPMVKADRDQLQQVFTNLIENAVKYGGRDKTVRVMISDVSRHAKLRDRGVRVDVIDQGAGIDRAHLPRLTERFYRVDSHRSREMGGTGLGLAIVKHIVSRHRGFLKINSELGVGSTFSVLLPSS